MKHKGFTMIELLGVITLMGILAAIAVPSILSLSEKMKIDMYCDKVEFVVKGAQFWGQDNYDTVYNDPDQSIDLKISTLVNSNYIKKDEEVDGKGIIVNPKDKSSLNDRLVKVYIKNSRIYANYVFNDDEKDMCK